MLFVVGGLCAALLAGLYPFARHIIDVGGLTKKAIRNVSTDDCRVIHGAKDDWLWRPFFK